MITYELHPGHEVVDIIKSYEEEHYSEIKDKTMYPDKSVDWNTYVELSKLGLCYVIFAKEEKEIIGYSCYTLTVDLNRSDQVIAMNVALFIKRKYRGRLVVDFIKECDKILGEKQVKQVLHSYSDNRIGKLLEKAGYKPKSITWCRTL